MPGLGVTPGFHSNMSFPECYVSMWMRRAGYDFDRFVPAAAAS